MINQFVMVGTVLEMPTIKKTTSNVNYAHLTLSVQRAYRSMEGEYDYDQITCTLWRGIAESCIDICEIGSLIGVKGRIQANSYTTEESKTYLNYEIIAEKVSFLTQKESEKKEVEA